CTAPRAWRQPHVLQQHLSDIKEAVTTIADALDNFLDAAGRIAVVASSPKAEGNLSIHKNNH
uniref:Vinculin n=1 Tax=Ascaris lumbricoides TaxID=6252 RepID=A0A0M3HIM8_ASCLU